MFMYRPRSAIQVSMHLLDYAIDSDVHAEVLGVLGRGVDAAILRIERAAKSGNDDYADSVVEAETEIIESLLGAAYVVCQTKISAITQAALRCRSAIIADGLLFPVFGDREHQVRRLGPGFDAQWTRIEVLWALANYFKHRDEWKPGAWSDPQGLERHTIPILLAANLRCGSNGNLRAGAKVLGNAGFAQLSVFEGVIREWGEQVRQTLREATQIAQPSTT